MSAGRSGREGAGPFDQGHLAQASKQPRLSAAPARRHPHLADQTTAAPKEPPITRIASLAAILSLTALTPATAEQFAVQLDAPHDGASAPLQETLGISEIARLSAGGQHYVVLDAPGVAYVETFFNVLDRKALRLNALDADWTAPGMRALPSEQKLRFLRAVDCAFCTS